MTVFTGNHRIPGPWSPIINTHRRRCSRFDRVRREARSASLNDLRAIVLYRQRGQRGKLRATSESTSCWCCLRLIKEKRINFGSRSVGPGAIKLRTMFLLSGDSLGVEAFAVKFADILREGACSTATTRCRISISRSDTIIRLKQTLLNLTLRLREGYVSRGLRDEQLMAMIADTAGPLRSCAASLLELEGRPAASPKEALQQVAASLPEASKREEEISQISEARDKRALAPGGPLRLSSSY